MIAKKNAFDGDHFRAEGNHELSNETNFFCRIVTRALALRPRHAYIYFFQHSLVFTIFKPLLLFLEARTKLILLYIKFAV